MTEEWIGRATKMPLHIRTDRLTDEMYDSLGGRPSLNERVAIWITKRVGTMWCAYVFLGIGLGSIVGVLTGNATLALLCGATSSYVLQLVLLPIIMVGQNIQNRHHERHSKKLDQLLSIHKPMFVSGLKGEKTLSVPAGHIIAKGGEVRRAVTLRDKLMANRMQQKKGHGTIYWDSVVRVVEDHYGFTK